MKDKIRYINRKGFGKASLALPSLAEKKKELSLSGSLDLYYCSLDGDDIIRGLD